MIVSRRFSKTVIAVSAIVLTAVQAVPLHGETAGAPASGAPPAVRLLMIVGGVAHDYDALPRLLADNLDKQGDLKVRVTSDLAEINEATLADCDVILFNTCIEKGLDESQRKALIGALRQGKGVVALHCALWSFQDWPEFRRMLGGIVLKHGKFGPCENVVVHRNHPVAAGVRAQFSITSEPYYVDERSRDMNVIVQTIPVYEKRGTPEPQVWTTRYMGGRVFAITYGHDDKSQTDPVFLKLLSRGIRWSAQRLGPAKVLNELEYNEGFFPLYDGHHLIEWHFNPAHWKVKDGIIIGNSHPDGLKNHSFAIFRRAFGDFVLRFSVRLVSGNSGVQFRSQALPGFMVAGYQADVVPLGWGNLHEQNGRRKLVDGWTGKAEGAVNLKDWNEMEVEARGSHIILRTNGLVTADYTETDPDRPRSGVIALQLHQGEPMEVQFTNLRIKPLTPAETDKK